MGAARRAAAMHRRVKSLTDEALRSTTTNPLFGGALNDYVASDDFVAGRSPRHQRPSSTPRHDMASIVDAAQAAQAAGTATASTATTKFGEAGHQQQLQHAAASGGGGGEGGATPPNFAAPGAGSRALAQHIVRNRSKMAGHRRKSLSQEVRAGVHSFGLRSCVH